MDEHHVNHVGDVCSLECRPTPSWATEMAGWPRVNPVFLDELLRERNDLAAKIAAVEALIDDRGWTGTSTAKAIRAALAGPMRGPWNCCDSEEYAGHVCLECGYQHCHCEGGTPGPFSTGPAPAEPRWGDQAAWRAWWMEQRGDGNHPVHRAPVCTCTEKTSPDWRDRYCQVHRAPLPATNPGPRRWMCSGCNETWAIDDLDGVSAHDCQAGIATSRS